MNIVDFHDGSQFTEEEAVVVHESESLARPEFSPGQLAL